MRVFYNCFVLFLLLLIHIDLHSCTSSSNERDVEDDASKQTYQGDGSGSARTSKSTGVMGTSNKATSGNDGSRMEYPFKTLSNICTKKECIDTAYTILANMDLSINPCEDFYKFSCGGFEKNATIPNGKTKIDAFDQNRMDRQMRLRASLEKDLIPDENKVFQYTKLLYKSCMNVDLIKAQGLKPLTDTLEHLKGWPSDFLSKKAPSFHWTILESQFRELGYPHNHFIAFFITLDPKNTSRWRITLDQPQLSLPREHLLDGLDRAEVRAYFEYMLDVAVLLSSDKYGIDAARITGRLRESLSFEISLAKILLPDEERENALELYNLMTLQDLSEKYPSIPWSIWMNKMLAPQARLLPDEQVNVMVPTFIAQLEQLLNKTSQEAQANYALWRAVSDSVDYLGGDILERKLNYLRIITGKTESEPRWQTCMDLVSRRLFPSVGALYVREYFPGEAKTTVSTLFDIMQGELRKLIKKVDWMDEKTKQAALDKADAMHSVIAYPDELKNDSILEQFYTTLELTEGNYLQSILNLTLFDTGYLNSQLRLPVNRKDWIIYSSAAEVDGGYLPNDNSIFLPAGLMQGIFFGKDRPRYTNYGAIGSIMSHEITHAFDDQGSQLDKNGELKDWWQEEAKKTFTDKMQCIIDQYGNYTDEGTGWKVDGKRTLSENIADNSGLRIAYLAYKESLRRFEEERHLPGLAHYSHEKMFWISAANVYCTKQQRKSLEDDIMTGNYAPAQFRVIGPMSNMFEFARDFGCTKVSKMNPEKRCNMW